MQTRRTTRSATSSVNNPHKIGFARAPRRTGLSTGDDIIGRQRRCPLGLLLVSRVSTGPATCPSPRRSDDAGGISDRRQLLAVTEKDNCDAQLRPAGPGLQVVPARSARDRKPGRVDNITESLQTCSGEASKMSAGPSTCPSSVHRSIDLSTAPESGAG